jgi:hypothetical protein
VWLYIRSKPSASLQSIALNLSTGWVFLPGFVLLYQENSLWMLVLAMLITLGMTFGLRRMLPVVAEPGILSRPQSALLPSLDGLPPADSPRVLAFWIAVFVQVAIVSAAAGSMLLAALALSIALFLFAWRWSAYEPRAAEWWTGKHPPLRQAILAILITSITLIPWSVHRGAGFYISHRTAPPKPPESGPHDDYAGIILWPPPKKAEIAAPRPHDPLSLSGRAAKPVVIPFDGAYWYFKAPSRAPDARAHVAHGKPTDVNVRSTDWQPLQMEAHQNLGLPIDLTCCSEIDLAITNADIRPGELSLALLLSDSTSHGKSSQMLAAKLVLSSQFERIPLNRPPVKETLRFAIPRAVPRSIPRSTTLRRFNRITVIFLPSGQRSRAGARVSIDSFALIPR